MATVKSLKADILSVSLGLTLETLVEIQCRREKNYLQDRHSVH